jgi:3-oxoacyl-[acyl-carrier protein] reductase
MSVDTEGRVALITGGSGGIGRAVVERLARERYSLVVHYAGNRDRAQDVADAAIAAGARAIVAGGDVGEPDDVDAVFAAVQEEFGGIDVVVHTAGVMTLAPIAQWDIDDFDRLVKVNLRGAFLVTRAAVRTVRAGGAIINFSSSVTRTLPPTYGPYVTTKAGLEGLSLIAARELRGRDVTANVVAPGPTATPLFLDGKDEATVERFAHAAPLERLAEPEDIAEAVAFLAGPGGRWVNGQTIFSNGGLA